MSWSFHSVELTIITDFAAPRFRANDKRNSHQRARFLMLAGARSSSWCTSPRTSACPKTGHSEERSDEEALSSFLPLATARYTGLVVNILLVGTYELGRQPFGLASPAAWLRKRGHSVRSFDLSRQSLDESVLRAAALIVFYLP